MKASTRMQINNIVHGPDDETEQEFGDKTFDDIYMRRYDGNEARTEGPGLLTLCKTEVKWQPNDTATASTTTPWITRFEDINLHAVGREGDEDDDKQESYVLVQFGEQSNEVRFVHLTERQTVTDMYNEFCLGIVRCPVPNGEDDDDDDMYEPSNPVAVVDHLDSVLVEPQQQQLSHDSDDGVDDEERFADAEEDEDKDNQNVESVISNEHTSANGNGSATS